MRRVPLQWMARQAHGLQPVGVRGTTLVEVLMAILVMSVGILSVMSLFPIAFLRSVQGTQLTNAAILKQQAETAVDILGLVSDDFIPQPVNGAVTRCVIDPLGFVDRPNAPQPLNLRYGVDAGLAPRNYDFGPAALPQPLILLNGTPFADDERDTPLRRLGLNGDNLYGQPVPPLRPDFFIAPNDTRNDILRFVALPDQFDTLFTAIPASLNLARTQATFDAATIGDALSSLTAVAGPLRLVLIDASGKRSLIRERTPTTAVAFSPNTIDWTVPLPLGFEPLSEVRVESQDFRYTWMLTVRKRGTPGGSLSEIDCVVFFNRPSADPEEELVHTATFPTVGPSIPTNEEELTATVNLETYPTPGRTAPLRKGGYVFDPTYARWYRVQQIISETAMQAIIQLDRKPPQLPPGGNLTTTLVVPRGVVQVFPLDTRRSTGR